MNNKSFHSKILLFGEYSVMMNSKALCIPYMPFEGQLQFKRNNKSFTCSELQSFSKYMRNLADKNELDFSFDINSLEFDISQALFFDSTIPQGYGVGSSAALCAALYDKYTKSDEYCDLDNKQIIKLKKCFAKMESHFHGESSGVDPLISYLNKPLLIEEKNKITPISITKVKNENEGMFLLNTARPRRTEPLVNLYLEKCKNDDFKSLCEEVLIPATNSCIDSFLKNDDHSLKESFKKVSDFQYKYFRPMIPTLFSDLWADGLSSGEYSLKLCGAGGGGFILGHSSNLKQTLHGLRNYQVKPLNHEVLNYQ